MVRDNTRARKVACFTREQQSFYESLSVRQRKYVDFRGQGYSKTKSYEMAGYSGSNMNQAAYNLERGNKGIAELIDTILTVNRAKAIVENKGNEDINRQIDALALQKGAEKALAVIDGADGETARRIQFYRDVASGRIKTVKRVKKLNAVGDVLSITIEEISDIDSRMKARKELDRILGLNSVIDIDKFNVGDITINIVDASKKEELEDSRNKIVLDADKVEVIDGETVIVEKEQEQVEREQEHNDTLAGE